ncbi:MAG TPA: YetF domain-containing protein, partial [Miltoncostaeaceae bacterium]|nr:YetF domain-containing protein [Miltoncostaeaceae bacterium]
VLRLSGKRTLAKMNAFDLIVTVALGSTLATALLSPDVSLVEALLAFALLAGLQFAVAATSVRSARVRRLVKAEPRLLFHRGRYLDDALRAERVAHAEVRQAIRSQGVGHLSQVAAVVLETDGSFSVLTDTATEDPLLTDVGGADDAANEDSAGRRG